MDNENRVVVLIDMDCFYCQVEEKLDPELKGKPIAVVQYNPWKGGGIIAVNYVARAMGVTRHMRGDEAKEKCPEIQLPSVPCHRGKANISKYRDAGIEVAKVLQKFTPLLERASIDEAYLDITVPVQERLKTLSITSVSTEMVPNTYALGYDTVEQFVGDARGHGHGHDSIEFDHENARSLLVGAVLVSEIRAAVYEETGYRCSAGIAHNKILAKLVCGMNKPNKQTILPKHSINILYNTLSVKKVKHLGGKFGDAVRAALGITSMAELQQFTEKQLQGIFDEKNGTWLYNIARGVDHEPVRARFNPKSIGCCKQFRGKSALLDLHALRKWLQDLGDEIEDRLEKDAVEAHRSPRQMVVSFATQARDGRDASSSRSYNFAPDDDLGAALFTAKALELVVDSVEGAKLKDDETNRKLKAPIKFLGISVGKFEDNSDSKKTKKINDYFGAGSSNATNTKVTNVKEDKETSDTKNDKKNDGKEYIMQKFFKVTDNVKVKDEKSDRLQNKENIESTPVLESSLAKQESFFAKFLNGPQKDTASPLERATKSNIDAIRPKTPQCNVVNCGEDSNDTDYSSSTINNEINKSIALFEDDPQDVCRVSDMRDLLNKSTVMDRLSPEIVQPEPEKSSVDSETHRNISPVTSEAIPQNQPHETFECAECKKIIFLNRFEEHADYHLALKLREEERQQVRKEIKERANVRVQNDEVKKKAEKALVTESTKRKKTEETNKETGSISSFFVKLDDTIPTETCSECGKKVASEKLTEHLDFHEAQKLNRQLNKKSTMNFVSSSIKRKKKSVSPVKKAKVPCTSRSIDSFFR